LQNLCATIALGDKCTSTSARLGTSLRLETRKNKEINIIIIIFILIIFFGFWQYMVPYLRVFFFWGVKNIENFLTFLSFFLVDHWLTHLNSQIWKKEKKRKTLNINSLEIYIFKKIFLKSCHHK